MAWEKEFILLQSQDIEEAGGELNFILNRDGKKSRTLDKWLKKLKLKQRKLKENI